MNSTSNLKRPLVQCLVERGVRLGPNFSQIIESYSKGIQEISHLEIRMIRIESDSEVRDPGYDIEMVLQSSRFKF